MLGLAVAGCLWWLYFDVTALSASTPWPSSRRRGRGSPATPTRYLHLPMVAGIVLLALGLKKVLEYVGDTEHHGLDDPLKGIGLYRPVRRRRRSTCSATSPSSGGRFTGWGLRG